jgi:hypothetical protein
MLFLAKFFITVMKVEINVKDLCFCLELSIQGTVVYLFVVDIVAIKRLLTKKIINICISKTKV